MSYNSKAFGNVIGQLRTRRGYSQEQLSGLAGISRSHLAMIESGKRIIRLDTLWKLAEAFDLPPHILIQMAEEESE